MAIQAVTSCVFALWLARFWSINGILIGILIPQILFSCFIKGYKLEKELFKENGMIFVKNILLYILNYIFVLTLVLLMMARFHFDNYTVSFFAKSFFSLFLTLSILTGIYNNNETFTDILARIKTTFFKFNYSKHH